MSETDAPEPATTTAPVTAPGDPGPAGPPPPVPEAREASTAPSGPPPAAGRSRGWVGVLVVAVLLAALLGANVVLFRRVRSAQDAADRAAAVAATQVGLSARLDALDARVAGVDAGQGDTADRVTATDRDVTRLRTCVNDAIDALAKSISTGKATTVTKC